MINRGACRKTGALPTSIRRPSRRAAAPLNKTSEQWDLVVGNPPWWADRYNGQLRYHDANWELHRRFFAKVTRFLKPGGVVVLAETNSGSTVETFRSMIEEAGLSIVFTLGCEGRLTPYQRIYYIGIARRGDEPPAWSTASAIRV